MLYENIQIPPDKNNDGNTETGESVGSLIQFKEIFDVVLSYKF
jgi:hypothetical protein